MCWHHARLCDPVVHGRSLFSCSFNNNNNSYHYSWNVLLSLLKDHHVSDYNRSRWKQERPRAGRAEGRSKAPGERTSWAPCSFWHHQCSFLLPLSKTTVSLALLKPPGWPHYISHAPPHALRWLLNLYPQFRAPWTGTLPLKRHISLHKVWLSPNTKFRSHKTCISC